MNRIRTQVAAKRKKDKGQQKDATELDVDEIVYVCSRIESKSAPLGSTSNSEAPFNSNSVILKQLC